ncbi:MAG: ASKHA domain-containing protein [Thermodesulfobacteriota bacterium]|nr:ASKHA domain-containing protein [Thermodesulfobacteriota bacterium]
MTSLTVFPFNKTISLLPGETVHEALFRKGIALDTPCNGQGVCGQCRIRVENPADVPKTPHENLTANETADGIRLACCLVPERDMIIHVLSEIADDSDFSILEGEPDVVFSDCNPAARVQHKGDDPVMRYESETLPLKIWENTFSPKGLAIDIGTTTIVVSLISLKTGEDISTASALNPQIKMGHDVMTRIQTASTPDGLKTLSDAVHDGINRLVTDTCRDAGANPNEILDVVLGGNTTMLEIAGNINPEPLGHVPFTVDLAGGTHYSAADFGLKTVNPDARLYIPPIAHAFVGSDISAGMLVCKGFFDKTANVLFIDIGTNGEIALQAGDKTLITSTAAGPAFEGMGLSSGMNARIGAVDAVETTAGNTLAFHTIGGAPARGICGSGVIDLTACLIRMGVLELSGRMLRPGEAGGLNGDIAGRLCEIDGMPAFEYGDHVYFTQKDVRQVQLAKSAIKTAVDVFIKETGHTMDQIVVSGGFGHTLNPDSLAEIGLIPFNLAPRVSFAGNTSLLGCRRMLVDVSARRFIERQMAEAEHLSLAERPDFMEAFVENSEFPDKAPA